MMPTKNYLSVSACLVLLGTGLLADEVELEQINVETHSIYQQEDEVSYSTSLETDILANHTTGETLGDYLSSQLGVDSASYGPAVGRPVVRGMEGYRVGIVQGGVMLNDLSAMSQDHAVGLNARVAERIEMVKGPASLLYGSYSGGVIRTLGEEHEAKLPKKGLSVDASLSADSVTGFGTSSLKSAYAVDDYSFNLNYYRNDADSYESGGEIVPNSDTFSEQLHGVLGWKISPLHTIKLYADTMDKTYGIPNRTSERTEILMEQQRYGVVLHSEAIGELKNVVTEYQYSDYNHFELEAGRYDGAFDQQQHSLSSEFDYQIAQSTDLSFRLEWIGNALKVCHEHGRCETFEDAIRTPAEDGRSLLNYYNATGIPYSHGHPMPDTEEQKILLAPNIKHYLSDADELSLGANIVARKLTPDPVNIQETWLVHESIDPDYYSEDDDVAFSLSLGWWHSWSDKIETQASLAYMERLPSAPELFWNGFHHATESYIIGNRDLDKEQSINLDIDAVYKHSDNLSSRVSFYYYDFDNYIYQSQLVDGNGNPVYDPFHNSPVYQIEGDAAKIYGVGIEETYKKAVGLHLFTLSAQFNFMQGKLDDEGYIPRMPPYNATFCVEHDYMGLHSELTYEWVDDSNPADNETPTDGYSMLNFSMRYHHQLTKGSLEFWLIGNNLTDVVAQNNLSFLKDTAPLPGRSVTLGIDYKF
ncbi:MAG: TonB-dependent receptor [Campylobacterota bacterium]|nr:TonB-dependent receptor [Campylobacterota bacterium]